MPPMEPPPGEPWRSPEASSDEQARREAYLRLAASARRVGVSLERLHNLLQQIAHSELETRRFLSDVYRVPDDLLDDLVRVRLAEVEREDDSS